MADEQSAEAEAKRGVAWLRVLLFLFYVALGIAWAVYECNSQKILARAERLEQNNKYQTAHVAYMMVVERFPASFGVLDARAGLQRVEPAVDDSELPRRLGETILEKALSERFDPYLMDWLPFLACLVCGALLILVLLSRLRRPGLSFLAFLLFCVAAFGASCQLAWYGFFVQQDLADLAKTAMTNPVALYVGSYVLVGLTVLLTLTSTRPREQTEAVRSGAHPEDERT